MSFCHGKSCSCVFIGHRQTAVARNVRLPRSVVIRRYRKTVRLFCARERVHISRQRQPHHAPGQSTLPWVRLSLVQATVMLHVLPYRDSSRTRSTNTPSQCSSRCSSFASSRSVVCHGIIFVPVLTHDLTPLSDSAWLSPVGLFGTAQEVLPLCPLMVPT